MTVNKRENLKKALNNEEVKKNPYRFLASFRSRRRSVQRLGRPLNLE